VPTAYNLPTLFQFVSGTLLLTLHCAMADVKATATVLHFPIFWDTRTECIFRLSTSQDQQQQGSPIAICPPEQLDNGSDSDSGDLESSQSGVQSVSSSSSTSSEDEDITSTIPLGGTWEKDCDFQPAEQHPTQQFEEHFTATGHSRWQRVGLQCSSIEVSTPLRAWRQIFTNSLLDKIVKYTNEY
jgi:hypothetical protein